MKLLFLFNLFLLFSIPVTHAEDWLQFRGNDSNGLTSETNIPSNLKQIAWSIDLEGKGASGPVVVENKIFISSCSGFQQDRLHVICFDTETGKKEWERQVWATGSTTCHEKISVATPNPASDGKRILASYSSNDVACYDLDGNLLWFRGLGKDYPHAINSLGLSSSPIIINGTAVLQIETEPESFAIGLDMKTGTTVWKINRPRHANWSSPSVLRGEQDLAIFQSSEGITAHDPKTGYSIWKVLDSGSSVPSTTIFKNQIFVPSGGIKILDVSSSSTTPKVILEKGNINANTASPVIHEGNIYTINGAGVLKSSKIKDGETNWQLRLPGGRCSCTPIIAANYLFAANEKGNVYSVNLEGKKGEISGTQKLDEMFLGTPALSNGALYLRSNEHLWKITN